MSDPPSARSGPLRVGLIGFGAIGRALWSAIGEGRAGRAACPAILVRRGRAEPGVPLTADRDAFLAERLDASRSPRARVACRAGWGSCGGS